MGPPPASSSSAAASSAEGSTQWVAPRTQAPSRRAPSRSQGAPPTGCSGPVRERSRRQHRACRCAACLDLAGHVAAGVRVSMDRSAAEGAAAEGVIDVAVRVDELDSGPRHRLGSGEARRTFCIIDAGVYGERNPVAGDDPGLARRDAGLHDQDTGCDLDRFVHAERSSMSGLAGSLELRTKISFSRDLQAELPSSAGVDRFRVADRLVADRVRRAPDEHQR